MGYDFSKYSEKQLVDFITDIFDIEEVSTAIRELYKRNSDLALQLSKNIFDNNLGDKYLQATLVSSIFNWDSKFVFDFFLKNIDHMNYILFGAIIEWFALDVYQPFGQLITKEIIRKVEEKYNNYSSKEKNEIIDKYKRFEESYKTIL